jgi:hypothetical protein
MTMTKLLEQAVAQIERLPEEAQNAIAERLLAELEDALWDAHYATTTEAQWAQMAVRVREEIAAGNTYPLDEILE